MTGYDYVSIVKDTVDIRQLYLAQELKQEKSWNKTFVLTKK